MFRVFAVAEVLDVRRADGTGMTRLPRTAHRAAFHYTPREGYLYVRSRAISSRCNDNFDMFPAAEIKQAYRTFIGKPVFVNHHNEDHKRMRGVVIDAALHEDRNPDGSPDTWAEVLMEVDGLRFPKLAEALLKGEIDRTSMGCDVQISKCSICANEATTPLEYCQHIPHKKGQRIYVTLADGRREGKLVYEECRGLSFFENSLLVEPPADATAFFLGQVETGPGLEHLHAKVATRRDKPTRDDPYATITHCEGPGCRKSTRTYSENHESNWEIGALDKNEWPRDFCGPRCALNHMEKHPEQWDQSPMDPAHPEHGSVTDMYRRIVRHEGARVATIPPATANQHIWVLIRQAEAEERAELQAEAAKPKKPVGEMSEDEYAKHQVQVAKDKKAGETWNRRNPVKIKNIVDHWNKATEDEQKNGLNWYRDAHELTRHVSNDTGVPMHTMAGLMSNYSPQTHWATNMMTAAKVARTGIPLGGKGDGIMATKRQKTAADRMLSGEHYDSVLSGPKTRAFAHLIEHGQNADPEDPKVVIDRHALSVAAGARANDNAYMYAKLGTKTRYNEVSQAYHKAAKQISKQVGFKVEAHQVQAATWLARQRLNEEHDRSLTEAAGSRSATRARSAVKEWNSYAAEHHPDAMGKEPGTGYSTSKPEDVNHAIEMENEGIHNPKVASRVQWLPPAEQAQLDELLGRALANDLRRLAYGETKAPQTVDTLRDENCPICGNDTAFGGRECQICGYILPIKPFDDPDVDKAKELDSLKQTVDDQNLAADPSRQGAEFADPTDMDEAQATGDDPASPWLECGNCGTGLRPAAPATGEVGQHPDGPAEGDPCPVCQQGELVSTGQPVDQDEQDEPEAEPGETGDEVALDEDGQPVVDEDDEDEQDEPDAEDEQDEQLPDGDEDEDEDQDENPDRGGLPASKKSRAAKYRPAHFNAHDRRGTDAMADNRRTALQAMAAQQKLIDDLTAQNAKQATQIQRLTAGLATLARAGGVELEGQVKVAMIRKRADEQNPAQPIPEPAPEPSTTSTPEAETPEAFADVQAPGLVPGSTQDVAADAVSTAYTPGQDIGAEPFRQLVDPTRPVDGTQGPRPLSETKTLVDVRTGNPMNPQVAFPVGGDFANAQRTSSIGDGDLRTMASIRLARLQIQAGIAEGEDLEIAQRIAADSSRSTAQIGQDIATLTSVSKAAAKRQPQQAPHGLVPRSAGVQRTMPAMASTASLAATAANVDDDIAAIFLTDLRTD